MVGQPETDDGGRISSGRKKEPFPVWVLMGSEGTLSQTGHWGWLYMESTLVTGL